MIEFRDVHASYDSATPILKGVSFTVEDGEFVAFVGTNGAGKSTTMRLMNGLLKPESGEVLIDGVSTTELKTSELARRVGFLFQNPDSQICCSTVREELQFGFKALGILDADAESRVEAIIEDFRFNPDDDPFLLNRGTRQLLALASIVVLNPPVVVLDEPTTGLDFRECVKVMRIIDQLHKRGTTVVMVCHDMEVVGDFAERVIVMSDGRVVDQGPTFQVLRNRHTLEQASLVPPQIVDISLALPMMNAALGQTAIAHANTLNDMQSAVIAQIGSPRVAGMLGDRLGQRQVETSAPGAQELEFLIGGRENAEDRFGNPRSGGDTAAASAFDSQYLEAVDSPADRSGGGMSPDSHPLQGIEAFEGLLGLSEPEPEEREAPADRALEVGAAAADSSSASSTEAIDLTGQVLRSQKKGVSVVLEGDEVSMSEGGAR